MADFTGIVRRVDHLGRIVIPKEIRKQLDIKDGEDSLEMSFTDSGELILKKYQPNCIFCKGTSSLISFNKTLVCSECIENLTTAKENFE